MENDLTLSEKLLLLAIRPEKGGIFFSASQSIDFCLTGALLLELELSGNITIRDKRTEVVREVSTNPLHAYLLGKMLQSGRPRKISYWLNPFIFPKKRIRNELYLSLTQKRQIRLEDKRFLFFTWKKPWLSSSHPTWRLIDSVKNLMYQDPGNPEELYLAALIEPAQLWGRIYREWAKRRNARRKIKEYLDKPQPTESMQHAAEAVKTIRSAIRARVAAQHAAAT